MERTENTAGPESSQVLTSEAAEAENFVALKLEEWGLRDYIPKFEREKIDKESFLTIPKDGISELITEIGPRFTFLRKREEFLATDSQSSILSESVAGDSLSISSRISSEVSCSSRKEISSGQKLRNLLQASVTGRYLLSQIYLTQADRNQLTTIIIEELLNRNLKIKTEEFEFWATEIVSVFKHEKLGIYFTAYKGGAEKHTAKGKLWDKYSNIKRKIKKTLSSTSQNPSVEQEVVEDNDDLLTLQCTSLDDEATIKSLWKKTFIQRRKDISIETYFDEYLMLRAPIGPTLLQIDYETLGLADPNIFSKTWTDLSKNIIRLAEEKSVSHYLLQDKEQVSPEVLALRVLPYLFRPGFVKTGSKKKWKPSKQEQADGFILWINTMADMEKVMVAREKLMRSYNLTCQPIVVVVGSPAKVDAAYVCVNDVKYKFTNVIAAVDTCFKTFYALNAKYPVQSEAVWIFLQVAAYGIQEVNRNYVSVSSILTDLERIQHSGNKSTDNESVE